MKPCNQLRQWLLVSAPVIAIMAVGCTARATAPDSFVASRVADTNVGKAVFVARCASCHNERGDKPLRVGLPLNQRKLSREVVTKAVQGRLKDKSQAEQQAVVNYILSLRVE